MEPIYIIDLAGTMAFAISGVLAASQHKMDLFGATILATVTAIGGGTLRDVMIGRIPVGWLQDMNYFIVIIMAVVLSVVFKPTILRWRKTLFLFDSIGIGLFTILGLKLTYATGLSATAAVTMGVVSAVFGGVMRDVLCNEVPLIFRKDFYATVCLIGAISYFLLFRFSGNEDVSMIMAILLIIVLRLLAVKNHWRLPRVI